MNSLLKFFFHYQKGIVQLQTAQISREGFSCGEADGVFYARCASRNTVFITLYFGVMSFFLVFGPYQYLTGEINLTVLLIMLALGLYGLRRVLWALRGTENLIIKGHYLYLKKEGSFWMGNKTYELQKITAVKGKGLPQPQDSEFQNHLQEMRSKVFLVHGIFFNYASGDMFFKYGYETVTFFNQLTEEEKSLLVAEITKRIPRPAVS